MTTSLEFKMMIVFLKNYLPDGRRGGEGGDGFTEEIDEPSHWRPLWYTKVLASTYSIYDLITPNTRTPVLDITICILVDLDSLLAENEWYNFMILLI